MEISNMAGEVAVEKVVSLVITAKSSNGWLEGDADLGTADTERFNND